uniref:Large ribosomal subunit protein uL15/eL18 domain-containing protein n=1 Tax=Gopherus agassizii TaxID=38772 RepID=A0A452GX93_9SAUR
MYKCSHQICLSSLKHSVSSLMENLPNSNWLARSHILKAGGQILTFDQLAMAAPQGQGTVLLSRPRKGREVYRHFSKTPQHPYSHNKRYVSSKGPKFKQAQGRRISWGYKN